MRVIEHSGSRRRGSILDLRDRHGRISGCDRGAALFSRTGSRSPSRRSATSSCTSDRSRSSRGCCCSAGGRSAGRARLSRIGVLLLAIGLGGRCAVAPCRARGGIHTVGHRVHVPCVTALLSRVISPESAGCTWASSRRSAASRAIAPLWAGFAYDHPGTGVPFFTSAAVVLATLLLGVGSSNSLGLRRRRRTPGREAGSGRRKHLGRPLCERTSRGFAVSLPSPASFFFRFPSLPIVRFAVQHPLATSTIGTDRSWLVRWRMR